MKIDFPVYILHALHALHGKIKYSIEGSKKSFGAQVSKKAIYGWGRVEIRAWAMALYTEAPWLSAIFSYIR